MILRETTIRSRSSSRSDPWHYARAELARQYLAVFDIGLTSARGLFARRRMGKSEFLEQDLIPAARAQGYLTAYLDLWDARAHPAPSLVATLTRAIEPTGWAGVARRRNTPLKKVRAPGRLAGVAEAAIEAGMADTPRAATPLLSDLLRAFDKPGRRLLLILDEAQVLADPAHADLAHSLRAGLDSRKQNIKVVFAGSSEPTLRSMFGRPTAPFYNWAPLEPFDLLGEDFVKAMVGKVNGLSRFRLGYQDALAAFHALNETPEFFRRYLNRYLTHAWLGPAAALEDTRAHVFNDANFRVSWDRLLPADREVLKLIAEGVGDLHSGATRLRLGKALGLDKPVTRNTPQQSLVRLQADGLVTRLEYGVYEFQDDVFAEWLRHRQLDIRRRTAAASAAVDSRT